MTSTRILNNKVALFLWVVLIPAMLAIGLLGAISECCVYIYKLIERSSGEWFHVDNRKYIHENTKTLQMFLEKYNEA